MTPRTTGTPRWRALVFASALAMSTVSLAGCAADPAPTASPDASSGTTSAPVFASDEEALAAAVAAYERYLDVSAEIAQSGGENADRILAVADGPIADQTVADFDSLRDLGLTITGRSTATDPRLASADGAGVQIYVCLDASDTRVIDASGADATPPDRDVVSPMLLSFSVGDGGTVLTGSEVWSGDDFC